jgi:hypothetical protein
MTNGDSLGSPVRLCTDRRKLAQPSSSDNAFSESSRTFLNTTLAIKLYQMIASWAPLDTEFNPKPSCIWYSYMSEMVDEAGQCVLTMILSETLPEVSDSGFGPSK